MRRSIRNVLRVFWAVLIAFSGLSFASEQVFNQKIPMYFYERRDAGGNTGAFDLYDMEFVDFLEKKTGYQFERVALPWLRAQQLAKQGKGLVFGFTKTLSREKDFDFSEPILESRIWGVSYVPRKLNIRKISDLEGKCVAVVRGTTLGNEFEEAVLKYKLKVEEDIASPKSRLLKLIGGRCDVILLTSARLNNQKEASDYVNFHPLWQMDPPKHNSAKFVASEFPLFSETIHIAAGKGKFSHELKRISDVLISTKNSPEYKRFISFY